MFKKNVYTGLLIQRLTIGILMLFHGLNKAFHGLGGIKGMLADKGLPMILAYGVYIGEIIVPLLIIAGFRTRIASAIYGINMLFALFLVHTKNIFTLNATGGWGIEIIALYLFGAIVLFYTGGGKYAVSTSNKWD